MNPDLKLSLHRMSAILLRYLFLLRSSWPRKIELIYWPTIQMLTWGFMSHFLATNSTWLAYSVGLFLGAVILFDVLFRSQIGFSINFLEEIWSRHLGYLFISPIRVHEWVLGLFATSLIRITIGIIISACLSAWIFDFSLLSLGWPLIAFFLNLVIMGWWLALIMTSLILRYGLGAEELMWMSVFFLVPFSCVYYPVDFLPSYLQVFAWSLPATSVFEGMRSVLFTHSVSYDLLAWAFGLNCLYLLLGWGIFLLAFRNAQRKGSLFQQSD